MKAPSTRPQRRRSTITVIGAVGALLALTSGYLWAIDAHSGPAGPIGGPFALVGSDGQPVTDLSLHGKYLLIYFGYTHCGDVCPITLTAVAAAMDALGSRADQVQPVFITVDPQRDTPPVVAAYVAAFTPRLLGLTGSVGEIARLTRRYHVTSVTQGAPDHGSRIDHSSVLYLVGPDGRYLAPVRADESGAQIARKLAPYLS